LTWRVSHSRILSPIELASVTCMGARLPKLECVEHTLLAEALLPVVVKYGCPIHGGRKPAPRVERDEMYP